MLKMTNGFLNLTYNKVLKERKELNKGLCSVWTEFRENAFKLGLTALENETFSIARNIPYSEIGGTGDNISEYLR